MSRDLDLAASADYKVKTGVHRWGSTSINRNLSNQFTCNTAAASPMGNSKSLTVWKVHSPLETGLLQSRDDMKRRKTIVLPSPLARALKPSTQNLPHSSTGQRPRVSGYSKGYLSRSFEAGNASLRPCDTQFPMDDFDIPPYRDSAFLSAQL